MKKLWILLALLGALLSLTAGCETMRGLGKDVEDLGQKMEDAAD